MQVHINISLNMFSTLMEERLNKVSILIKKMDKKHKETHQALEKEIFDLRVTIHKQEDTIKTLKKNIKTRKTL